jgi:hypothetical protein
MLTQYSLYPYTNKAVCVLLQITMQRRNPPLTLTIPLTQPNPPTQPRSNTHITLPSQAVPPVHVFQPNSVPPLLSPRYMPHMYCLTCYHYANNTSWTVTHMKLTTNPSASLYSYPLSHKHYPPPYRKPSISVPLLLQHTKFHTTQNNSNNVSSTDHYMQHSELNCTNCWLNISCLFVFRQILSVFNTP